MIQCVRTSPDCRVKGPEGGDDGLHALARLLRPPVTPASEGADRKVRGREAVSYTHLRAHETEADL
eukprot:1604601-Rhodomonas_salina.1